MRPAQKIPGIRIAFYRRLSNSYGRDFKVVLSEITVEATSPDHAVDEAIRAFEKERGLCNWTVLADGYQVVERP